MKLNIVTPLRDEVHNIEKLFQSVSKQTISINEWVIIENDSSDGSKEYLNNIWKPNNVKKLNILNLKLGGNYEIGTKYSFIINKGFETFQKKNEYDYVGILDSDCFPEPCYFETLIYYLENNKNVGIVSGVIIENNRNLVYDKNHARGGCRIWRKDCFLESGYLISMSADSVSEVLARLKGWKTKSIKSTYVISRSLGAKVNYEYYGRSVYYRGFDIKYIIIKSTYLMLKLQFFKSYKMLKGYMRSYYNNDKQIENIDVRNYYKNFIHHKIKNYFR